MQEKPKQLAGVSFDADSHWVQYDPARSLLTTSGGMLHLPSLPDCVAASWASHAAPSTVPGYTQYTAGNRLPLHFGPGFNKLPQLALHILHILWKPFLSQWELFGPCADCCGSSCCFLFALALKSTSIRVASAKGKGNVGRLLLFICFGS